MRTRLLRNRFLLRAIGRPVAFILAHGARLSGRRVGLALVYHGVAESTGDPNRQLVPPHGARLFEAQVRHARRAYHLVPASELLASVRSRRRGQRIPVAITFDDDLASHRRVAMPILLRAGVPATFFLCGRSLNAPFSFWWEDLQAAHDRGAPIETLDPTDAGESGIASLAMKVIELSPEDRDPVVRRLREWAGPEQDDAGMREDDVYALVEAGFEIGFHTLRHDYLPSLDKSALEDAFRDGRTRLEAIAGRRIVAVGYPHGNADARVAAAARAANFQAGFTTHRKAVTAQTDPLLQGRLEPSFVSAGHFAVEAVAAWVRAARRDAATGT